MYTVTIMIMEERMTAVRIPVKIKHMTVPDMETDAGVSVSGEYNKTQYYPDNRFLRTGA